MMQSGIAMATAASRAPLPAPRWGSGSLRAVRGGRKKKELKNKTKRGIKSVGGGAVTGTAGPRGRRPLFVPRGSGSEHPEPRAARGRCRAAWGGGGWGGATGRERDAATCRGLCRKLPRVAAVPPRSVSTACRVGPWGAGGASGDLPVRRQRRLCGAELSRRAPLLARHDGLRPDAEDGLMYRSGCGRLEVPAVPRRRIGHLCGKRRRRARPGRRGW